MKEVVRGKTECIATVTCMSQFTSSLTSRGPSPCIDLRTNPLLSLAFFVLIIAFDYA